MVIGKMIMTLYEVRITTAEVGVGISGPIFGLGCSVVMNSWTRISSKISTSSKIAAAILVFVVRVETVIVWFKVEVTVVVEKFPDVVFSKVVEVMKVVVVSGEMFVSVVDASFNVVRVVEEIVVVASVVAAIVVEELDIDEVDVDAVVAAVVSSIKLTFAYFQVESFRHGYASKRLLHSTEPVSKGVELKS